MIRWTALTEWGTWLIKDLRCLILSTHKPYLICNMYVVDPNFLPSCPFTGPAVRLSQLLANVTPVVADSFSVTTLQVRGFSPTVLIIPPSGPTVTLTLPLPWQVTQTNRHYPERLHRIHLALPARLENGGRVGLFSSETGRVIFVLEEEQIRWVTEIQLNHQPKARRPLGGTGQLVSHSESRSLAHQFSSTGRAEHAIEI